MIEVVLASAVMTAATLAPAGVEPRPRPLPLRQEEDWSSLKDASKRTAALDPAKYLGFTVDDHYLTLGGEARTAYELFINEDYGRVPQDDSGSWLLRMMAHANLRLGSHFRGFAQLKSTHESGRDGGPTPVDVDRLDLHQGFAEFSVGDPRRTRETSFSVRLGRQELLYGAGRLIDVRDGPAVRRSFDTVLSRLASRHIVLDALLAVEVPTSPGVFDDVGPDRPRLWGSYLRTAPGALGRFGLDGYYLGVEQTGLVYTTGSGRERRHSVGGRWWSTSDEFRHDVEFTYQFGAFDGEEATGDAEIRAWGAATSIAYAFPSTLRPEVSVSTGVTSGDTSSDDAVLETFRSPFPNLRFAGATTRLGPSNLYGANVGFGLSPARKARIQLSGRTFWRTSRQDAVYSPIGFPQRASPSLAGFVGGNVALFGAWFPNRYVVVYSMVEAFVPGAFLRSAPPAETSVFMTLGSQFRF